MYAGMSMQALPARCTHDSVWPPPQASPFDYRAKFLAGKKTIIAAMPAKTRRLWTSYVTLVDRLCYPHPHGINLFISRLLQNVKSCVPLLP